MDANNAANIIAPYTAKQESFSATPYYDVNGYAIGYGNHYYSDGTSVDATDDPISQTDAYNLMVFFLAQNAAAIIPQLTVDISDSQLGALADLRYRCGTITTALLNLINSGASDAAVAAQIANTCVTSGGQPSQVEVNRASDEANLYLQGGGSSNTGVIVGIAIVAVVGGLLLFNKS